MIARSLVSSLVLAAIGFSLPCAAQAPSSDAQSVFQQGIEAFAANDFRRALDAFERVFALRGNPDLLFNIYRCHRAMGDPGRAANALRRFLVARPDRPDRAELELELGRLDADARALAVNVAPAPAAPTPAPVVVPTRPPPRAPPRDVGPGPWITVGVGVALAGVGAGLMVAAASANADASNAGSERARTAVLDDAAAQYTAGAVMLGVGGAAVLGGALWRVFAPRGPAVAVSLGHDRVALTLSARWP